MGIDAWTADKPNASGWYWFRGAKIATPKPLYVDYGFVNGKQVWYAEGCAGYIHDWPHGEWLGPITPDSFQQGRVAGLVKAVEIIKANTDVKKAIEIIRLHSLAQQAQ